MYDFLFDGSDASWVFALYNVNHFFVIAFAKQHCYINGKSVSVSPKKGGNKGNKRGGASGGGASVSGETTELDLATIGIEAYFGVNEAVTLSQDSEDVEAIDLSEVTANIITTDGMEITTACDEIGEALTSARQEIIKEENLETIVQEIIQQEHLDTIIREIIGNLSYAHISKE